jgi:hypothetical protein
VITLRGPKIGLISFFRGKALKHIDWLAWQARANFGNGSNASL